MEKSRIPVRIRNDAKRADRRPPPSSSSRPSPGSSAAEPADKQQPPSLSFFSSLGTSSAEKPPATRLLPRPPHRGLAKQPTGKRRRASLTSHSVPGPSFAERPVDKRRVSRPSSYALPGPSSAKEPVDEQQLPSSFSPALSGPPQSSSTEQPTGSQPHEERSCIGHTRGRPTGHYVANNVAKDKSRVHYGDNYNETHHHNYQGPNPNKDMPRSLEEAIAKNKKQDYVTHVMRNLSFERMGLRRGTVAPALINTCQWLLTSPEYIDWRDPAYIYDHHGLMWIKSKAGAGKSTMMKFLLESTRSRHSGDNIISFFFNARGDRMETSLNGLYRHLLHQLLCSVSRLRDAMIDDVNTLACQGWQLQPLKDLFRAAVLGLRSERFTCFIDALDEAPEDDIQDLIDFFEELGNDVVASHISFRVCFSSRHYPNIELEICQYLNLDEKAGHEDDIAFYIRSKLKSPEGGVPIDLLDLMQKKAQGVFLWAVLVTQMLNKDYRRGDVHKVRSRVESIPPDIHSLFHEMIHRNVEDPSGTKDLVLILQWIAFARRPLAPQELYYAIRSEDPDFDISQLGNPSGVSFETMKLFILNRSKGLAELTTSYRRPTIQFIHESVRDFLNHTGFDILTPGRIVPLLGYAHSNLTKCCLRWITSSLYEQISRRLFEKHRTRTLDTDEIPLLSYVVENMIEHADLACRHGVSQEDFVKSFSIGLWMLLARCVSDRYLPRERPATPTSVTEILAFHNARALLAIELGRVGPRLQSYQYETALRRALYKKSMTTVEFLLHNGSPSHNSVNQQAKTLLFAVDRNNTEALQLIIRHGKHAVLIHDHAVLVRRIARLTDAFPLISKHMRAVPNAKSTVEPASRATFLQACLQDHEASVENDAVNYRPRFNTVSPACRTRVSQIILEHRASRGTAQEKHFYPFLLWE
ncbi:hypothetical protein Q7P35_001151 [Cladosporium inversicolor]